MAADVESEYARMFGAPPSRDAVRLRGQGTGVGDIGGVA